MPSISDHQQTSMNRNKIKTTQQTQINSSTKTNQSGRTPSNETTFIDPINQAILVFEKKQRNLGKRKEKLESYQQEAKNGKELNKDQKEALEKYSEVIGQIECIKDISEQFKKIQNESTKNQKRLQKQAAEEKRLLIQQRLREFCQLRYLLDHRPSSLTQDDQLFLDELHLLIIPSEFSLIHRSIETILSIYHNHSINSKIIQQRNNQEIKDKIEDLIQFYQTTFENNSTIDSITINPTLIKEDIQRNSQSNLTTLNNPSNDSNSTQLIQSEVRISSLSQSTSNQQKSSNSISINSNEFPFQLDTRNQNVSLKEILEDSPFFSLEINHQQDLKQEHFNDSQQYSKTITIINSDLTNSVSTQQTYNQDSSLTLNHEEFNKNNDQENSLTKKVNSNINSNDEQPMEEQWQQRRTNSTNNNRIGQYQTNGNRNSSRGTSNHYHQQQQWRGSSRENPSNSNEQRQQYYDNINQQQRNIHSQQRTNQNNRNNRNNSGFYRGQSNGLSNQSETLSTGRNRSTNFQ